MTVAHPEPKPTGTNPARVKLKAAAAEVEPNALKQMRWEDTEEGANANAKEHLECGRLAFPVVAAMMAEALRLNVPEASEDRQIFRLTLETAAKDGQFLVCSWSTRLPLPRVRIDITNLKQFVSVYDVLRWYQRTLSKDQCLSLKHPGFDMVYSLPEPAAAGTMGLTGLAATGLVTQSLQGAKGVQKRVLVNRYRGIWPSIDTDLKDAATNGLAAAAKAGKRGWLEEPAVAWARKARRVLNEPAANSLNAVMAGEFIVQRHTIGR